MREGSLSIGTAAGVTNKPSFRIFSVAAFVLLATAAGFAPRAVAPEARAEAAAIKFATETLVIRTAKGAVKFTVEFADNDAKRALGLMNRPSMAPDHGMLFDFEKAQYVTMWMRDTLIPLDMLFIDAKGKIISIAGARPLSERQISSGGDVRGVLELNAGAAKANGVDVGDIVEHRIFGTAKAK